MNQIKNRYEYKNEKLVIAEIGMHLSNPKDTHGNRLSLSHANSSSCGRMNKSEGDNEKYRTVASAKTRKEEKKKQKKKKKESILQEKNAMNPHIQFHNVSNHSIIRVVRLSLNCLYLSLLWMELESFSC